ncbi:eukaryotic translation initiation factor 4E transporter, putative [Pediculus humanus corporis]|uniref:Eukaryotic translation initiation factor 4E transporter, putative n=1 Tax=Pediculus humanus subsp. corporis TaxID=121224 RepID=E0W3R4_PEDHC|nr:eukaryotic translation initiation factor 4E transporter, putative [Pediculus humanus corporis]EEB20270.1 eukaryotic translation initiation factor 4E transporter, putative [Pediculus humanus corporis]
MDPQTEKDHLEEGEIEGGGDGKPPYKPDYQYSREELLKYSDHPLSRQRPIINDPNIFNLYCWLKSGGWNNCKRSDTPTDRGDDSYKVRKIFPKPCQKRVRKEQDGIVLSPQRRSFNSGCFVTVAPNSVVRPPAESTKEGPVRRIGSGRIINRDWEYRDKENADDGEVVRDVSRESLSRDKDIRSDPRVRDRDRLLPRYSIDRRRFEAEEPEWFSGGPTSQHDTVELRGFDDSGEDSKSNTGSRKSSAEEISVSRNGNKKSDKEIESEMPTASSSPKADQLEPQKTEGENSSAENTERTGNHDFLNLEDFLQLDNLPLLTNGGGGEGNQSSSRFSQWFRRDSPSDVNDTRRSSIQDELIKNIINDISEPSINIPNAKESDAYFAPISPAGTTSGNSLLELLQNSHAKSEHHSKAPSIKDLEASGKVTSVEELEARMRQGAGQSSTSQISQTQTKKPISSNRKEEELIAFKKLLKQVAEGGVTTANDQFNRSPASCLLYQMLNKPPEPSDMMGQAHQPATVPSMHVPQDLVYKLLHQQRQVQQQQEFNKLLFSSGRLAPPHVSGTLSPLPPDLQMKVANSQPSAELLSRPEAQAILQGLRQGEITPQHLIQQLQNPAMQPRHREVLASILKLHGSSPRPASPLMVSPDPTLIQQLMLQQQLRNPSPMPPMPNGLPHRVPSPRELMLHTQTIMQSALIKKKLEEQRENFRKRQELQRAASPNVVVGAKSPNPPTSSVNNSNLTNTSSLSNLSNINNNNNNCDNKGIMSTSNGNVGGGTTVGNSTNSSMGGGNVPCSPATSTSTTTTRTSVSATTKSSPTPLAFTPTSVLRKMTADQQPQIKDGDGNKLNKYNELFQAKLQRQNELFKATQSSRFLANNQLLGLRNSQQQQWSVQKQPIQQQPIQQGRAIVKGSSSYTPAPPIGPGLVDPITQYGNNGRGVFPQRSKWTMPNVTPLVQPNLYNNFPTPTNRVPQNRGKASMHGAIRNSFPQFMPPNGGDGDLSTSPTGSNQLAHWFTPELLAQAQAQTKNGKSDSTVNMVSVEELERIQQNSAPVIN